MEHIEIITVPRSSDENQAHTDRVEHNDACRSESYSNTKGKESMVSVKSWPKIQSVSKILRLHRREAFLEKLSEKIRPEDACLCKDDFDLFLSAITVRNVETKKKMGWFPVVKGIDSKGVSSKQPVKFYLTDLDRVHKDIWAKFQDVVLTIIPFSFAFGVRRSVIDSLTRTEKVCYSMFAVYFNIMADSIFHGLSDPVFSFYSEMSGPSLTFISEYLSWQRLLTLLISMLLVLVLNVIGQKSSKSWKRKVEDPTSYWQGLHPIYSCWRTFLFCLKSCHASKQVKSSMDNLMTSDNMASDKLTSTSHHGVCFTSVS